VVVNSHVAQLLNKGLLSENAIKHHIDAKAREIDYEGKTSG
jgi:hypothetical protein